MPGEEAGGALGLFGDILVSELWAPSLTGALTGIAPALTLGVMGGISSALTLGL